MKYLKPYNESLTKIKETNNPEFLKYWDKLPLEIREKCENTDHNNPHHMEGSILNHISLVFDAVIENYNNDEDIEYLKLAAILHDLGKVADGIKQDKNGKSTFNRHEEKSLEIIDDLLPLYNIDDKEKVKYIVENHMLVHQLDLLGAKTLNKMRINEDYFNALIKFAKCDEGGRYTSDSGKENQKDINDAVDKIVEEAIERCKVEDEKRIKRELEQEKSKIRNQKIKDVILDNPNITIAELQEMFNDVNPKAIEGIYKSIK